MRYLAPMLTALLAVIVVLAVVIHYSSNQIEPSPDYTQMNKDELKALIMVDSQWLEPRARLAQLHLEDKEVSAALRHMLVLAWDNWPMNDLEYQLKNIISESPHLGPPSLELLSNQRRNWAWPHELGFSIALLTEQQQYVLDNLFTLLKFDDQHPLAYQALAQYRQHPLIAWQIAEPLGRSALGQVVDTILASSDSDEIISNLRQRYPGHDVVSLLTAYQKGGEEGLDKLFSLEAVDQQPNDLHQYGTIKLDLLLQVLPEQLSAQHLLYIDVDTILSFTSPGTYTFNNDQQSLLLDIFLVLGAPSTQSQGRYSLTKHQLLQSVMPRQAHLRTVTDEYFDYLLPNHLFAVIENWNEKLYWAGFDEHGLMQAIDMAIEKLSFHAGWSHLKTISDPPTFPDHQFKLTAEDRRDQGQIDGLSLSPNGKQLIYLTTNSLWWYDLEQQEYLVVQGKLEADEYYFHWAPNSQNVAVEYRRESGNQVDFYSLGNQEEMSTADLNQATVLGWQNNNTLLTLSQTSSDYRVRAIQPDTSSSNMGTYGHVPVLTPNGRLAWTKIEDKELTVSIRDNENQYSLPAAGITVVDWLAGDRGLLLQANDGTYLIIDFTTGISTEIEVEGNFIPHALSWTRDNKLTGIFNLGLVDHVMVLDLDNMSLEHTGIRSHHGRFSGNNHYWYLHYGTVYIHQLP